jgi:hypothetical protein
MTDADLIGGQLTPSQQAAEDAAFAAAFTSTRDAEAPAELVDDFEKVAAPAAKPAEPTLTPAGAAPTAATPADPAEPAAATPAPVLFAGLTEEQLAGALARSSQMQGTVDKMAGRIGQLMQQIETLRAAPPTTQAGQAALNLKLEKLSAAFPEMAAMLREDLSAVSAAAPTNLPAAPPAGMTQEQVDAALNTRLATVQAETNSRIEEKVLGIIHPDWLDQVRSPQFALWRDNVLGKEVGQKLMTSEDSSFISKNLTEFKAWRAASLASTTGGQDGLPLQPAPVVVTPVNPRQARLANAVLPTGGAGAGGSANTAVTEEDGFQQGFAAERKKAGMM